VGLTVDPNLLGALLADVRDAPGHLPLLEDCLTELWTRERDRPDQRLTLAGYQALGGLHGTLARRADALFATLSMQEQAAVRWILVQLTRMGEGTEDTRRRVVQADLVNDRYPAELIARTLVRLADARLAVSSALQARRVATGDGAGAAGEGEGAAAPPEALTIPTVEVAHEALIRHWPRLRDWLDRDRAFQTWLRRIQPEAQDWGGPDGDQDPERLPRGARLAVALEQRAANPGLLDPVTQSFIDTAVQRRDQERTAEQERQEREFWEEAARREAQRRAELQAHEDRQRTRLKRTRLAAALTSIGLVVSIWLGYLISAARDQAQAARNQAQAAAQTSKEDLFEARLTQAALLAREEDYAGAWRVLGQSADLDPAIRPDRRHARNLLAGLVNLYRGVSDQVYRGPGAALMALAVSPDGHWLAAGGERGTLVAFDRTGGEQPAPLATHDPAAGAVGAVTAVAFSPDGGRLYSAGEDGRILAWSVPDWQPQELGKTRDGVRSMALSPKGEVLASAGQGAGITLWSTASGAVLGELVGESSAVALGTNLAWFSDGVRLVSEGRNGKVGIWDTATRKERLLAGEHSPALSGLATGGVAISPGGALVASDGEDGLIVLADTVTGKTVRVLKAQDTDVSSLVFDGSDQRLIAVDKDQSVKVWDTPTGTTLRVYQGHDAGIGPIVLHDGVFYTASNDGTVQRWPLGLPDQWAWDLDDAVPWSVALDPDRGLVLVGLAEGSIRAYALPGPGSRDTADVADSSSDTASGSAPKGEASRVIDSLRWPSLATSLLGVIAPVNTALAQSWVLGPERDARGVEEARVRARTAEDARVRARMALEAEQKAGGPERDARKAEAARMTLKAKRAAESERSEHPRRPPRSNVSGFSAGANKDLQSAKERLGRIEPPDNPPEGMPEPRGLEQPAHLMPRNVAATQGPAPQVTLLRPTLGGAFSSFALSPDGRILAIAGDDHRVRLWAIVGASGDAQIKPLDRPMKDHQGAVRAVAFSPDGRRLVTASDDRQVGIFDVASGTGEFYPVDEPGQFESVQIDGSGTRVVTANLEERTVQLWHLDGRRLVKGQPIATFADKPLWATLNPDGRQIAAVGRGSNVTLIDLDAADRPMHSRRLRGHQDTVYRAIYSPDGGLLATVSADRTLRVWDLKTDAALFTLHLPAENLDPGPLWDFDFRCTQNQRTCWIAVPLTMGRLALYRLPYADPPPAMH
jgi:WD40 repeat protein